MTHGDLFTGIGGFTIAAAWAGFRTAFFSEIDPYCCELLRERWPGVPNLGDIRTADFLAWRGRIDVLSAGVPCQPASLAGKRRGAADDRWLWDAVLDVVGLLEPTWCIFENPPGILTLDEFGGILLRLESFGYQVRMFSVPANSVGAKHRRQRVFIVANRSRQLCDWSREPRARGRNEPANGGALADCDSPWQQQQGGIIGELRERTSNGGEALADSETRSLRFGKPWSNASWRLTEPPLCGRVDGLSNRSHRLKCLGNAVVPQQVYPFFEAIARVELSYSADYARQQFP